MTVEIITGTVATQRQPATYRVEFVCDAHRDQVGCPASLVVTAAGAHEIADAIAHHLRDERAPWTRRVRAEFDQDPSIGPTPVRGELCIGSDETVGAFYVLRLVGLEDS